MSKGEINDKELYSKALDIAFANSEFLSVIKGNMQRKYKFVTYRLKHETGKDVGILEFGVECNEGDLCVADPNFSVKIDFHSQSITETHHSAPSEGFLPNEYSEALDIAFNDTKSEFSSVIKSNMAVENLFETYHLKHETDKKVGVIEFGVACKNPCLVNPSFSVTVDFVSQSVVEINSSTT